MEVGRFRRFRRFRVFRNFKRFRISGFLGDSVDKDSSVDSTAEVFAPCKLVDPIQ
jgi:hypothetical protein